MTAVPLGREPVSVEELARIERAFLDAENELNRRLADILNRGPEWFREEARLRRLLEATREQMAVLQQAFDEPTISGALGELYATGASTQEGLLQQAFQWNNPHLGAVDRIAGDTFDDLLTATRYVEQSAKQIIRQAAKINTTRKLTTGKTAIQAGAALARDLRSSGIGVVTYRNGARHGVGEYSRMVLRTKTAVAYNSGTLNFIHSAGVKVVEIFDGSDCGLSYHDDPTLANGLIVDTLTAATYVIAHPNCRRSFGARPDLTEHDAGQFRPSTTADQRADQQAFEKFMKADKRSKPHPPREPRAPRAPRTPRTPRAEPVAPPVEVAPEPVAAPEPATVVSGARGPAEGTTRLGEQFEYLDDKAAQFRSLMDEIDGLHGITPLENPIDEKLRVAFTRQTGTHGGYFGGRVRESGETRPPPQPRFRGRTIDERVRETEAYRAQLAAYEASAATRAPRIEIAGKSVKADRVLDGQNQFAFAHEVGHRVDFVGMADDDIRPLFATVGRATFSGEEGAALEAFIEDVKGTDAVYAVRQATVRNRKMYTYVTSPEELWARAYSQWVATELRTPELLDGLRYYRDEVVPGYQWSDDEFERVVRPAVERVLRARGLMR